MCGYLNIAFSASRFVGGKDPNSITNRLGDYAFGSASNGFAPQSSPPNKSEKATEGMARRISCESPGGGSSVLGSHSRNEPSPACRLQ